MPYYAASMLHIHGDRMSCGVVTAPHCICLHGNMKQRTERVWHTTPDAAAELGGQSLRMVALAVRRTGARAEERLTSIDRQRALDGAGGRIRCCCHGGGRTDGQKRCQHCQPRHRRLNGSQCPSAVQSPDAPCQSGMSEKPVVSGGGRSKVQDGG